MDAARITVARTPSEVEALRPLWSALEITDADADLDLYLTVTLARPNVIRPHVVAAERPGRAPMLAVARLEHATIDCLVGYRAIARPAVRMVMVSFGGIVGAETESDHRLLLDELRRPLDASEADVLSLPALDAEGPMCRLARSSPPWRSRDHLVAVTPTWTVPIPSDFERFLADRSGGTRRHTRYYARRLRQRHPDMVVRCYRDESDVDAMCAALEHVAERSYQRRLGVAFTADEHTRRWLRFAAGRGWLRAWVMSIDGEPVAFWHGVAYGGRFALHTPGFDPAFSALRVGACLLAEVIDSLCRDPAVELLDYGSGDAQYKRAYGGTAGPRATVLVFAPTAKALIVNLVRTAAGRLTAAAARTTAGQRLKRSWRRRLART